MRPLNEVFPKTGTDQDFGCVYSLTFNPANRVYVGSTMQPIRRIKAHQRLLVRNKHHCIDMQLDYNKFGWDAFSAHVIELVEKKSSDARQKLVQVEADYIKSTNAFYNSDFRAAKKQDQAYGAAKIRLSKDGIYSLVGNERLIKKIADQQQVCLRTLEKWIIENSDNLTKAGILNMLHQETGIPISELLTEKAEA